MCLLCYDIRTVYFSKASRLSSIYFHMTYRFMPGLVIKSVYFTMAYLEKYEICLLCQDIRICLLYWDMRSVYFTNAPPLTSVLINFGLTI